MKFRLKPVYRGKKSGVFLEAVVDGELLKAHLRDDEVIEGAHWEKFCGQHPSYLLDRVPAAPAPEPEPEPEPAKKAQPKKPAKNASAKAEEPEPEAEDAKVEGEEGSPLVEDGTTVSDAIEKKPARRRRRKPASK